MRMRMQRQWERMKKWRREGKEEKGRERGRVLKNEFLKKG
jgi:hypothetical protein